MIAGRLLRVGLPDRHIGPVVDDFHDTSIHWCIQRLSKREVRLQLRRITLKLAPRLCDHEVQRMALSREIVVVDERTAPALKYVPFTAKGGIQRHSSRRRLHDTQHFYAEKQPAGREEEIGR